MAKKRSNKSEVRPVVQTPVKVCLRRVSRAPGNYSRKVLPSMTVTETEIERMAGCGEGTVKRILDAAKKCVGEGKDVSLCESLRFYGVVDKNAELILCSQTMNQYRRSISDVKYVTVIRDSGKHETVVYHGTDASFNDPANQFLNCCVSVWSFFPVANLPP